MAPVTRAQERGGRVGTRTQTQTRRGDGKPETVKETTTTTSVAGGGGGKRKGRKRDRTSPNPLLDHIKDPDSPRSYPDYYDPHCSYPDPDPPRSYPDRNATMDKCYEMKEEAESKSKTRLEELETLLRRKQEGLTYKSAIDQLIKGILDPTLKKVIIEKICEYVACNTVLNRTILFKLLNQVEHWDHEVIRLIVGLVNNLKNVVIIIPGLDAVSAIANSILSWDLDEVSEAKLVEELRELVSRVVVSLLYMHEKMDTWAKSPTPSIDPCTLKIIRFKEEWRFLNQTSEFMFNTIWSTVSFMLSVSQPYIWKKDM
ncbi:hypothetical protein V2J09_001429 [Rumex salicifolius]